MLHSYGKKGFEIGTELFLIKRFSLSPVLSLIMISLLLNSCINDLEKTFRSGNYHEDMASLVDKKSLDINDILLPNRLKSGSIARGEGLSVFTYESLKQEKYMLALQVSRDISIIKSCFDRKRQNINTDSLIMVINPAWHLNDTLKFYYITLLINEIAPDSKALGRIETAIGKMISSPALAYGLVHQRMSFRAGPSFYNDDVADKKIIHFALSGDRSFNEVISTGEREKYVRNGWRIVDIP